MQTFKLDPVKKIASTIKMPSFRKFAIMPKNVTKLNNKRIKAAVMPKLPPMAQKLKDFNSRRGI